MSSSKKTDLWWDFAASVYLSEAQNPITPQPLEHCIRVYSILIHTGKEGELNQSDGERGITGEYRSQSWVENTNMTECTQEIGYLQSINYDKHLPQRPFTGQYFLDDDILHCLLWVLSFYGFPSPGGLLPPSLFSSEDPHLKIIKNLKP
jgi:hypothetical protein